MTDSSSSVHYKKLYTAVEIEENKSPTCFFPVYKAHAVSLYWFLLLRTISMCELVEYSRVMNNKMEKRDVKRRRRIPFLSLPRERPFALTFALPT